MLEQKIIDEVKAKNEGVKLFGTTFEFVDADNKEVALDVIYRKPNVTDMEMYTKTVTKSSVDAQLNLLITLAVYPEGAVIRKTLGDYTPVVAEFINEKITPFFGSRIKVTDFQI